MALHFKSNKKSLAHLADRLKEREKPAESADGAFLPLLASVAGPLLGKLFGGAMEHEPKRVRKANPEAVERLRQYNEALRAVRDKFKMSQAQAREYLRERPGIRKE